MTANIDIVTPNEVLQAIEYAKTQDPIDKNGDGAFFINTDNCRDTGKTSYMDFKVLKKQPDNKWKLVSMNLKFKDLTTRKNNLPPNDPKRDKVTFIDKSHSLQFLASDVCKTTAKNAKGEIVTHIEEYGRAKVAIYKAFSRLVKKGLLEKKIIAPKKKNICTTVQFVRKGKSQNSPPIKIDDPIIRVDIPFPKIKNTETIELTAKPKCTIYDATKKIEPNNPKYNPKGFNYEIATIENPDDANAPFELNYTNLGTFLRAGSIVSGVDQMSSVCLSASGISLPSKLLLGVVIPGKGFQVDASAIFGADEQEDFGNTNVVVSEIDENSQQVPPNNNNNEEELDEITKGVDDIDANDDEFDTQNNGLSD